MPTPLQPPPPAPARRKRQPWTDFERLTQGRDHETLATGSAVVITILLHATLFMWMPWMSLAVAPDVKLKPEETRPVVEYSLTPVTPEDMRFVEANPNAPVSPPSITPNISDRDQRAAQDKPNPDDQSDLPRIEGTQQNSVKIVQGDINFSPDAPTPQPAAATTPAPRTPPAAPAPPTPALPALTAQTQPPASPPEALAGKPDTGEGIRLEEKAAAISDAKPGDNHTATTQPAAAQTQPADDSPSPQPRKQVQSNNVSAGPLLNNPHDAPAPGVVALDSKITEFGEYQKRLYDAITSQWYLECNRYNFGPQDAGTWVAISFVLNDKGDVEELKVLDSNASRIATQMCVEAINSPASYGLWTKEMTALLGTNQTIRITFYYE